MFRSRVPRVFGLAGGVLIYLALVAYHYRFNFERPDHHEPVIAGGQDSLQRDQTLDQVFVDAVTGAEPSGLDDADGSDALVPAITLANADTPPTPAETQTTTTSSTTITAVDTPTTGVWPAPAPEPPTLPVSSLPPGEHLPEFELQREGDDPHPVLASGQCPELDFVKRVHANWHFSDHIRYKKFCIEPVFKPGVDRNVVANVSEPLFGGETTVDLADCSTARLPRCTPVQLVVPPRYETHNASHLAFGVSTDFERLQGSVATFGHWLAAPPGLGATLVALVTDFAQREDSVVRALEAQFRDAGMAVHLVGPLDESYSTSQSHFTVLAHMLGYSSAATKWFGVLDDDTFFPRGLKPLSDVLETLDETKDVYAGALSEDFMAIRTFGYMAFGGAGVYLSAPLAKTLGRQIEKCVKKATSAEGDIIIRDCVYSNSKAKLTTVPGLFQQDLKDDASGFFESGVQPINLHHWKSWYKEPVVKMSAAYSYCGDCYLQRWRFGSDAVFTNGYSIAKYIYGVDHVDLNQMEGTWTNANNDFDFSIGPLRRKLVPDEKKMYKLIDAELEDNRMLKQLYRWEGNSAVDEMDGIIELVWQH